MVQFFSLMKTYFVYFELVKTFLDVWKIFIQKNFRFHFKRHLLFIVENVCLHVIKLLRI